MKSQVPLVCSPKDKMFTDLQTSKTLLTIPMKQAKLIQIL